MHFLEVEDEKLASKYLSRASILYTEWGAVAKVNQLESKFGQYLNTDPTQIRSLKKSGPIPTGTLMFTDRKPDQGSQRAGRRPANRSKSQDVTRGPIGSQRSARSQRSASMDSHAKPVMNRRKNPPNKFDQKTQSSHARGKPVLTKAANVTQRRPSLVRAGSLSSVTSLLSNISDGYSFSRRGTKKKNDANAKEEKGKSDKRRNSTSSIPTMEMEDTKKNSSDYKKIAEEVNTSASTTAKEEKGKHQRFKRQNSTSSIPTMEMHDTKQNPSGNKVMTGGVITSTPTTAIEDKGKFRRFQRRNSASSISTMGIEDTKKPSSGYEKITGAFKRRKSTSSIPTMEIHDTKQNPSSNMVIAGGVEDKGKFRRFQRRNSASSISTMGIEDTKKPSSGYEKITGAFKRRKSTSSIPTMEIHDTQQNPSSNMVIAGGVEDKGKFRRFQRRNSASSIPTMEYEDSKRSERKNRGPVEITEITLTPTPPKKKAAFSGPIPSPGPRKAKLALLDANDLPDYLIDYDTDDFDTVSGDSITSLTHDKELDEPEVVSNWKKGRKKMMDSEEKEKKTKKSPKKKKTDIVRSEEMLDLLKTPKRKTKAKAKVGLKSKTLTL